MSDTTRTDRPIIARMRSTVKSPTGRAWQLRLGRLNLIVSRNGGHKSMVPETLELATTGSVVRTRNGRTSLVRSTADLIGLAPPGDNGDRQLLCEVWTGDADEDGTIVERRGPAATCNLLQTGGAVATTCGQQVFDTSIDGGRYDSKAKIDEPSRSLVARLVTDLMSGSVTSCRAGALRLADVLQNDDGEKTPVERAADTLPKGKRKLFIDLKAGGGDIGEALSQGAEAASARMRVANKLLKDVEANVETKREAMDEAINAVNGMPLPKAAGIVKDRIVALETELETAVAAEARAVVAVQVVAAKTTARAAQSAATAAKNEAAIAQQALRQEQLTNARAEVNRLKEEKRKVSEGLATANKDLEASKEHLETNKVGLQQWKEEADFCKRAVEKAGAAVDAAQTALEQSAEAISDADWIGARLSVVQDSLDASDGICQCCGGVDSNEMLQATLAYYQTLMKEQTTAVSAHQNARAAREEAAAALATATSEQAEVNETVTEFEAAVNEMAASIAASKELVKNGKAVLDVVSGKVVAAEGRLQVLQQSATATDDADADNDDSEASDGSGIIEESEPDVDDAPRDLDAIRKDLAASRKALTQIEEAIKIGAVLDDLTKKAATVRQESADYQKLAADCRKAVGDALSKSVDVILDAVNAAMPNGWTFDLRLEDEGRQVFQAGLRTPRPDGQGDFLATWTSGGEDAALTVAYGCAVSKMSPGLCAVLVPPDVGWHALDLREALEAFAWFDGQVIVCSTVWPAKVVNGETVVDIPDDWEIFDFESLTLSDWQSLPEDGFINDLLAAKVDG